MRNSDASVPFARGDVLLLVVWSLALGLFVGLLLAGYGDPRWTVVRIVVFGVLLAAFIRRAWRALPGTPKAYPTGPRDVAHFGARQAERERTIGHK